MARPFWHPMTEQPTEPERGTLLSSLIQIRVFIGANSPENRNIMAFRPIFSMSPYGRALISPIRRQLNTGHASRPQHIYFEDFAMKIIESSGIILAFSTIFIGFFM